MPVSTRVAALFHPYEKVMALTMSSKSELMAVVRIRRQAHLLKELVIKHRKRLCSARPTISPCFPDHVIYEHRRAKRDFTHSRNAKKNEQKE
jgi:hypothetical protein